MIDDQIVRNPYHPRKEPAVITVFAHPEGLDDFNESFLEKIFSKLLILNGKQNVRIHLATVPVN